VALATTDKNFWRPIPIVMQWLTERIIRPSDRVIDIGCGHCPFPRANVGVDMLSRSELEKIWDELKVEKRPATVQCDLTEPLPFNDKEFDFVFCRHTVEDMGWPFPLLREMARIGEAGYIETPSPIAELTHGADGYGNSAMYRGYYHHRFVVWVEDGRLNLVSKYPMVEHYQYDEAKLEDALRPGPELWNTYYLWSSEIAWKHHQNALDFEFETQYGALLWRAALASAQSTEKFCQMINQQMTEKVA